MIALVRVFQTTIIGGTPDKMEESVLVSCRSIDGVYQLSMQVRPESAPTVGDFFDVVLTPVVEFSRV